MPSSRIIKSATSSAAISSFSFRSIEKGVQLQAGNAVDAQCGFVPLEIFDPSELPVDSSYVAPPPVIEEEPEIPGQFVSDEELQDQLHESYQRGLQDGKNLAERGLLNVFRGLRTAAEDLQNLREKVLRDSEDELLALVMAVSMRVIRQEVAQDRQMIMRVIKGAIDGLNESDEIVIRVHPDDYALLTTSQDQALRKELEAVKFVMKADSTLSTGSCLVETALGTVDASLEAQLDEIYRRLLEARSTGTASDDDTQLTDR